MKIAVIGLGLIGGSLLKALAGNTKNTVYGYDNNVKTLHSATTEGYYIFSDAPYALDGAELVLLALAPETAAEFVRKYLQKLKKGCLVVDVAGVKRYTEHEIGDVLRAAGMRYLGAHPMAGKEVSGYANSDENLFQGASIVLTPTLEDQSEDVKVISGLAKSIGFSTVTVTTPQRHDEIIAYTSQLAHVVSGAYIKSPTAAVRGGFSAGSYQDMTRVAVLDENLWSVLMMQNKEPLIAEIDTLIDNLSQYRAALVAQNQAALTDLLKDGREKKEADIRNFGRKL